MNDEIFSSKLQLLGKLSASLVHELRNPLSVIKMNLDYMSLSENELPTDVKESLTSCKEAAERMLFWIENFSDFSKKNSNTSGVCSVNEISQIAVNITQVRATRKNIYIQADLAANIPSIYFHKDKMLHVFLNLLNNAVDANKEDEQIFVRTYIRNIEDEQKIVWEIEDSGTGIEYDLGYKVFDDFFTSKEKGTGLGLSVCKSILQESDAEIHFESEPGRGTKFYIFFKIPNCKEIND